jgi:hypothetical protein
MLVTVPPAEPLIGVLESAVTRPLASILNTGIKVPLPTFDCAVVMAAKVAAAEPGPAAVTSPVKAVMAVVDTAWTAAVVRLVTRPLASTLRTGTTEDEPTLLCAVVIAARVGFGKLPTRSPPAAAVAPRAPTSAAEGIR